MASEEVAPACGPFVLHACPQGEDIPEGLVFPVLGNPSIVPFANNKKQCGCKKKTKLLRYRCKLSQSSDRCSCSIQKRKN